MGVVSDALTSGIGAASRSVARAGLDREINALNAKVKARKEALGMDLFAPLDAADYVQCRRCTPRRGGTSRSSSARSN